VTPLPLPEFSGPRVRANSVAAGLATLNSRIDRGSRRRGPYPTGFQPLDGVLGGGLEPGGLTVVGGAPARGKTIVTLQWARRAAIDGARSIYVCYEHLERVLLARLLSIEVGEIVEERGIDDAVRLDLLRSRIRALAGGQCGVVDLSSSDELLAEAVEITFAYSDRLLLVTQPSRATGDPFLELVTEHGADRTVLFVDHLAKVDPRPSPTSVAQHPRRAAEDLKDLAIDTGIAVVAIAVADGPGLSARRLTMQHLGGSTATAYEADAIVVLNEKLTTVSRSHLAFDTTRHEEFRSHTVFSVEKNRSGESGADLEFRKDFAFYRFRPTGRFVAERLWQDGGIED
jgi:replicative DNA helicase